MPAPRDVGLARKTWGLVKDVNENDHKELRSRAMNLGPMLLGSGLAATAAFLRGKAHGQSSIARAYRAVFEGLEDHVLATSAPPGTAADGLLTWLTTVDHEAYRRASVAAADFALWLRRAAEALIPGSDA